MKSMSDYRKLEVWKRALALTGEIYSITQQLPSNEEYGLRSQMRRSAVSVTSNIAEGKGCGSDRQLSRYLEYAYGSLMELQTQLIITNKLQLVKKSDAEPLIAEADVIGRMLNCLKASLERGPSG